MPDLNPCGGREGGGRIRIQGAEGRGGFAFGHRTPCEIIDPVPDFPGRGLARILPIPELTQGVVFVLDRTSVWTGLLRALPERVVQVGADQAHRVGVLPHVPSAVVKSALVHKLRFSIRYAEQSIRQILKSIS